MAWYDWLNPIEYINGNNFERMGNGGMTEEELAQQKAQQAQDQLSSAIATADFSNMSAEDMYLYMAKNDPSNSSGWMTNYASLKAQQEMRDTSLKSTMDQMKAAGINPLMAINSIGSGVSSGAGYGATSDIGQQETSKRNAELAQDTKMDTAALSALFSIIGLVIGGTLGHKTRFIKSFKK